MIWPSRPARRRSGIFVRSFIGKTSLVGRAFQGASLALSVSIAVAVVYVAHRRGREIAAPVSEPRAPDAAVSPAPARVASDALVPPSSAHTPEPAPAPRDKRTLRRLYGLQGPSTKAEPHLAKALYEEIARDSQTRHDGGSPR